MEGVAVEELVECVLAMKTKKTKPIYQSIATRASKESKMVEAWSTFNISKDVFVLYIF